MNSIAFFSSHGPSNDGRIKPDILAPGFSLNSVRANSENSSPSKSCNVESKAGSSMSTPVVAGNAVLIR
jgi:subtilisin family serine protease